MAVQEISPTPQRLGLTVQASSLLLCSLVAAAASSVALGIVAIIETNEEIPPLPGGSATPSTEIALIVTAAIFVVSWIAVAFAFCRDQVLHRVMEMQTNVASVAAVQLGIRADFAALRKELAEYAEQRETDGFLYGRSQDETGSGSGSGETPSDGGGDGPAHRKAGPGELRPLYSVPPID